MLKNFKRIKNIKCLFNHALIHCILESIRNQSIQLRKLERYITARSKIQHKSRYIYKLWMTALDIHSIYSPWALLLSFPLIITRATYGGTESRFTDGSVVVLVVVFFSSRAFAIGCARTQFSDPQSNFFVNLAWSP